MSTEETASGAFAEHLASLGTEPINSHESDSRSRMNDFSSAVELLGELSHAGLDGVDESLLETVERLGKLADSVEGSLSDFNDDDPDVLELVDFVIESCDAVRQATLGDHSEAIDVEQRK